MPRSLFGRGTGATAGDDIGQLLDSRSLLLSTIAERLLILRQSKHHATATFRNSARSRKGPHAATDRKRLIRDADGPVFAFVSRSKITPLACDTGPIICFWNLNMKRRNSGSGLRALAGLQAIYYALTGVWPLVHMPSFLAVTGPKVDLWLVETVGVLVAVVGAGLAVAAVRGHVSFEVALIAIGSALGLAAIDVIYVARGRIPAIYLLDAAAEAVLIIAWLVLSFWHKARARSPETGPVGKT
jgi:hypothetical protein